MHNQHGSRALARRCAAFLFTPALALAAGISAVPPATQPATPKAEVVQPPVVPAPARVIRLAPPTESELAQLRQENTVTSGRRGRTKQALAIGIGREISASEGVIAGGTLTWTLAQDGGRVARIDVTSPGAAGIRVAMSMTPGEGGVSVRFANPAGTSIFGPYAASEIARAATAQGAYWTPVIDGDTAVIELHAPAGASVEALSLTVLRVSHLVVAGERLRNIDPKLVSDIGTAGACEVDVACVAPANPALSSTARSVAKLVFTRPTGRTVTCTGTLVNDAIASYTPYLYTASHCIDSQAAASTLNTYWFFDAVACNSKAVPNFVLLAGGATLLGRSEDYDWSIVRLRDTPPAGAQFSAWNAQPLTTGVPAGTMHHPEGDLKKWSQGVTMGYHAYPDGSSLLQMLWTSGSTEPGSSGAGLFTQAGGYYELRGGLFGGLASCSDPAGIDEFSRLDKALPVMRQYLTPASPSPNGEVAVVEFYNAALDHYFITSNPAEVDDLDKGVHPGWVRTGLRFLAYGDPATAPAGATPVCRFYLDPSLGDSHFYSGDPAECAATAARFGASWTYESPSVFWTVLPDRATGACPSGMQPVYRFFHAARTNHRYTKEALVRDDLATTPGWVAEGYGPDATIMCSPEQ